MKQPGLCPFALLATVTRSVPARVRSTCGGWGEDIWGAVLSYRVSRLRSSPPSAVLLKALGRREWPGLLFSVNQLLPPQLHLAGCIMVVIHGLQAAGMVIVGQLMALACGPSEWSATTEPQVTVTDAVLGEDAGPRKTKPPVFQKLVV